MSTTKLTQERRMDLLKEMSELKESIRDEQQTIDALLDAISRQAGSTRHLYWDHTHNRTDYLEKCNDMKKLQNRLNNHKEKLEKYSLRLDEVQNKLNE